MCTDRLEGDVGLEDELVIPLLVWERSELEVAWSSHLQPHLGYTHRSVLHVLLVSPACSSQSVKHLMVQINEIAICNRIRLHVYAPTPPRAIAVVLQRRLLFRLQAPYESGRRTDRGCPLSYHQD